MRQSSVAHRHGRVALLLLLVAMLGALGVQAPTKDLGASLFDRPANERVTAAGQQVDATNPARAVGRPVATPSLLVVQRPTEGLPFGTTPSAGSTTELVRVGGQPTAVCGPPSCPPHRVSPGVRAPPSRQSDL